MTIDLRKYIIICFDHLFWGDIQRNTVRIIIQFFTDFSPTSPVHCFHFSHSFTVAKKTTTIFVNPKDSHHLSPLSVIIQGVKNFSITLSFDLKIIKIGHGKLLCCGIDYPNEAEAKFLQLLHCCNRSRILISTNKTILVSPR